jgi:hypothetical protein
VLIQMQGCMRCFVQTGFSRAVCDRGSLESSSSAQWPSGVLRPLRVGRVRRSVDMDQSCGVRLSTNWLSSLGERNMWNFASGA